jgi:PAS domain S-box-containing protein
MWAPMAEAPDDPDSAVAEPLGALDAAQLYALYTAARRLARAEGAAEVHHALLEGVRATARPTLAALYLPDVAGAAGALVRAAQLGGALELPVHITPAEPWRAALGEERLRPAAAVLGPLHPQCDSAQVAAIAGAETVYGLLVAWWEPGAPLPVGWAAALVALADDAGRALDTLRRRQDQERRGDGDSAQGVLGAVNAVSDIGLLYSNLLERLLDAILTQILAVLPLGGGAVYLSGELPERVELAAWARGPEAAYGPDPGALWEGAPLPHALAHAHETAHAGYPALAVTAAPPDEPHPTPLAAALRGLGAANLVSVPLLAGGWVTGVLQVVAARGREVTPSQVQMLRTLARQAATAIENARLFAQTRADQERARAVVEATNDAILMIDERRRPMIVNRRARFFFGLTERDMVGKSFDQLGALFTRIFEDGQRFNSWLGQILRSPSERAVEEFRILSPEPRLLQCYTAPVTDPHERYLGRLLVFRDITREREVERMKSDFVSIVSHELRTPLTSIQGALQLVLGQPESGRPGMAEGLPPRGRELLAISRSNTERLIRLINDILDIAKIEQGRNQLRREALSPEELCRSAAAEISAFANDRDIGVEIKVRQGLPRVLADRDRSVQILVNLLSNAIKFSHPGQRVLLGARRDGAMVSFTVQDWGRGIAPEQQARLFQKFQQLDSSSTRDVGGTGLGLAISKALVEEQGGRMWLDSHLGEGSSFSFTLPLAPGAEDEGAQAVGEGQPLVLVVDDDPHVRPVLVRLLRRYGMRVSSASDGYAALGAVEAQPPDVILLDIKMPGLDGFEVLRRLKARPATAAIPVIILTADDLSDSTRAQGRDLGAHAYLEKPIAYERLINSVNAAIGRDGGVP